MKASLRAAALLLGLLGAGTQAWAQGESIIFSAMGDVPYSSGEVPILQRQIQNQNLYSPSEFMVHVGDIKSGKSSSCGESVYRNVAGYLKVLRAPCFIIPGDNEWNGCSNPSQGWSYWLKYFNEFEKNFCGAPAAERQTVRHENWAFTKKGVLFVGINLVSTPVLNRSEWNTRLQQNADWVKQQLQSHAGDVRSAVVFSQSGPGSVQKLFFDQFRPAAAAFAKPILFLHGDGHTWKLDHPFAEANVTRLQVNNGGDEDPVQVTVSLDSKNPFSFLRRAFSTPRPIFNAPPCVATAPEVAGRAPAVEAAGATTGETLLDAAGLPRRIALLRQFPNPMRDGATVEYALPRTGSVELGVYDVAGQRVRQLVHEARAAGIHTTRWDGRDARGARAVSGVYFVRLQSGGATVQSRLLLLR